MNDDDQDRARSLVAELVRASGLSASQVARRAGLSPSTLTRIYPVPAVKYTLSARSIAKLQRAFPDSVIPAPDNSNDEPGTVAEARTPFSLRPPSEAPAGELPLFQLIPVSHGSVRPTGTDLLELNWGDCTAPIGNSQGWPAADPKNNFVVYMPGESMQPRFRSGQSLLVDKVVPPATGSEVLVIFHSVPEHALICIAQIVDRDRDLLRLSQYKYGEVAEVNLNDVKRIFAITGSFETRLR